MFLHSLDKVSRAKTAKAPPTYAVIELAMLELTVKSEIGFIACSGKGDQASTPDVCTPFWSRKSSTLDHPHEPRY